MNSWLRRHKRRGLHLFQRRRILAWRASIWAVAAYRTSSVSIEQFLKKRLLPLVVAPPVWLTIAGIVALVMLRLRKAGRLRGYGGLHVLSASRDDFVELSSIEPHPTALRAIVDLNPLSLAHHEGDTADRTRHTGGAGHRSYS
jgi:hypothetical protein